MTEPSANIIGTAGRPEEEERRREEPDLRPARHGRLVSRRELNATVEATIYGWGGTARLGGWEARPFRATSDVPMGSRLIASLRERPIGDRVLAKPPHGNGRTRGERES